jgi:predicted nucleic acid-binding protein
VDASAFVEVLLRSGRAAAVARAVIGFDMAAPDLLNVEVLSTLRRLERAGTLSAGRAAQAVQDLSRAPLYLLPTHGLLGDMWAMRANVSAYDAAYIALARALRCHLVTGDARLAHAPGIGIATTVV